MRDLVHAQPAACAAGAFRIVEHEVLGFDTAVDEVMRGAAQASVEAIGFSFRCAFHDLDLHQAFAHQQGRRDCRLDRLLMLAAHDHPIDDRIYIGDLRLLEREFL
jgi:hypothetical protein